MSEKQPILLALGRGYNGFFCPESRFHLVGVVKPQAHWPEKVALTKDVKRGLRGGTLVDVNKVLTPEDIDFKITADTPISATDRKKQQLLDAENEQVEASEAGELKEDGTVNKEQGTLLSEPDIDTANKTELISFIKKNEIELEGINSRSTADDLKEALKLHFGYTAAAE